MSSVLLLVALPPRAAERTSVLTVKVKVEVQYLCDGYASFGDADFYDCARRFFADGGRPAGSQTDEVR